MIARHIQESINSKGASVIRKMFEEGIVLKKEHGEDNVFDFTLGNPDLDPPEKVIKAIQEEAKDVSHGCHGYMPNAGYPFVREAIAQKVSKEQGLPLSGSNVIMTVGAASALNCVFKSILNPGDEVIVPAPFFAEYRHYAKNHGGILVEVPSKSDFSLDLEAIKSKLSEKTAAILINNPNNPSGKIYSEDEIKELAAILNENNNKTGRVTYLVCDEPYRAIVYDDAKVAPAFQFYDNTVIVSSFAKDLSLPGERIGYIAVNPKSHEPEEFIKAVTFSLRVLGCVNAPAFFQKVIAKSWDAQVDYSSYKVRRDKLMAILDKAGIEYFRPQGAFYLFCKVPANFKGDDGDFTDYLKKYLILAAPGSGFGGKGWFRLAYCVSEKTITGSEKAFCQAMKNL
ncbi:pyridoxal phosphate-dependent aminotransferase [Treponema ruminis]|uniref:Aminotransferase n=1 Tax=Treponema ruminis TaxID=744515 RepID=A0A7W8G7D5_9SPIR|nr:pyridoxal phosphate-dependent aminotransferase [Treponema ruminis]MBB5225233.1 aspartate aminotransferase [Treponema ruminis]QSI01896.1 pyridoxal phosphate-dependent aminotransferase [Treponema ruminis]